MFECQCQNCKQYRHLFSNSTYQPTMSPYCAVKQAIRIVGDCRRGLALTRAKEYARCR